ncbi:MAG: WXG100 family type VII secretion target [Ardenticatenia bacterium]|nr:WXG100 family type VII secretion target [Ardenticatenia bacterium]
MSDRVLSTAEAKQAITRMQQIINGGLVEQIQRLNTEGQKLSQPNIWDGRLAGEFRSNWPQTHKTLQEAQRQLEELRAKVQKINENIMRAGGNA